MIVRLAGLVIAAGCLAFAALWDPTTCVTPTTGIGCRVGTPCPVPVTTCTHEYVALRVAVGLAGVIIGVLLFVVAARRARRPAPPAGPAWVEV